MGGFVATVVFAKLYFYPCRCSVDFELFLAVMLALCTELLLWLLQTCTFVPAGAVWILCRCCVDFELIVAAMLAL